MGLAVGPRPPRLAHRVLGDGREAPRARLRDPRRRARPRLPAPRERARAVARARRTSSRRSGCTTGCSASPARRCRSRSATSSRSATRSTSGARETLLLFFLTGALAQADRLLRRDDRAGARAGASRSANASSGCRAERGAASAWERVRRPRSTTTSTRRRRLRSSTSWRTTGSSSCSRRGLDVFGLGVARRGTARLRPRSSSSPSAGARRASARDFDEADRLRARSRQLGWEVRDVRGRLPARPADVTRDQSTAAGRCARRCAAAARCSSSGRPSARSRPSRGSARAGPARPGQARSARSPRRPGRATTRASSRSASRTATRTPTSSRPASAPLLVCLDQVTDPHNLGAVVPERRGRRRDRRRLPAHGSARVTAAVCRASAGAVEHLPVAIVAEPRPLPGRDQGPDLWVWAALPETPRHRCGRPT